MLIQIPCVAEPKAGEGVQVDGWQIWNSFRTLCDMNQRLEVALELTEDLPATDRELWRWFAEPVKAVIVPTGIFLTNKQGYPVLAQRHKSFLTHMFRYKVQVIIGGLPEHEPEAEVSKYLHYIALVASTKAADELLKGAVPCTVGV
jgi:protein arginine N-methyltransferase 5